MTSPLSVFARKKREKTPLSMVALYDAPSAQIACDAGVDAVLVGDSLGNTVLGFDSTIPVTVDAIAHHVAAVVRGVKSSERPGVPVVADLPFGSYASVEKGVENAVRLMQLGAHAVKIEGTQSLGAWGDIFDALKFAGVPVMGHIGFTPQSVLQFEGVVQGKQADDAIGLLEQAQMLEQAGCFAVVLEAMTAEVAHEITTRLEIPTIGIGAGSVCSGQVLVWHDLVGLSPRSLKFAKAYAQTREIWSQAMQQYVHEVRQGSFPTAEHGWQMTLEEYQTFASQLEEQDELEETDPYQND